MDTTPVVNESHPTQRERAIAMDKACFHRAQERGQQTFTLVAQDKSAPKTILFWIMENFEHTPVEKLRDAFEDALAMREHPKRKHPD